MEIFAFCVITFKPIISKTSQTPQNDRQNLSFVKDEHTYGEKMARKGRTKIIYKGTFISKQSLYVCISHLFGTSILITVNFKILVLRRVLYICVIFRLLAHESQAEQKQLLLQAEKIDLFQSKCSGLNKIIILSKNS